jgi:nucleotide-binding universal stress UspA family protein
MFERIVVGTDGSARAGTVVERAATLATLTGAAVHLVQGSGSPVVMPSIYTEAVAMPTEEIARAVAADLELVAERLRATGLEVDVHVLSMSGQAAVCEVASTVDADLIVIGNRGMTGARRVLGSVPNSVAHHASCSVLIVETN